MTDKVIVAEDSDDDIPISEIRDVSAYNNLDEIRIESETIINGILQDDYPADTVIEVQHYFSSSDFDRLEKFIVEIDAMFGADIDIDEPEECEDIDGATIFTVDFVSWHKVDVEEVMKEIEMFIPLCNQFGIIYDSWGTQVVEYDAEDADNDAAESES